MAHASEYVVHIHVLCCVPIRFPGKVPAYACPSCVLVYFCAECKKINAHTLREPFAFLSRAYVRDITEHIRVVVIHHTFFVRVF